MKRICSAALLKIYSLSFFPSSHRKFSCKQIYWSCKPGRPGDVKEEEKPPTREDIFSKSLSSLWNFMARKKVPKVRQRQHWMREGKFESLYQYDELV